MIKKLIDLFFGRGLFVIADPRDNSITFSKGLCKSMNVFGQEDQAKVFVATLSGNEKHYAMILNPKIDGETQLAEIQYNQKWKCIGIESLCPTVNRILYDYFLPADKPVKLSVEKRKTSVGGVEYFEIINPKWRI